MKIAVVGLWHLGCVTTACLLDAGFEVLALDSDTQTVENLNKGILPIFEPGLEDLFSKNRNACKVSTDFSLANDADIVWITYDTPVDDDDNADVGFVENEIEKLFPYLKNNAVVLISSQMPVGSSAKLQQKFNAFSNNRVSFCCSPENLRLGKAIDVFTNPDRIIVGVDNEQAKSVLQPVLQKFSDNIIWMKVASAEMTKHAINAFLATSVVFINELASLCEHVGATASEVELGLKSESRIGPKAYLKPGGPFAGGTLARDIRFLIDKGDEYNMPSYLFKSIRQSNNHHKLWTRTKLTELYGDLQGKKIGLLGLTYKPGTNTLRRSSAVELAKWLVDQKAIVTAFDPSFDTTPTELDSAVNYSNTLSGVLNNCDAVIISTEWPYFKSDEVKAIISGSKVSYVIDPNNYLSYLADQQEINHIIIGN